MAKIVKKINRMDIDFTASVDDKQVHIPLTEIYYFEIVERKVFLYTQKDVYRLSLTMAELEDVTGESDIVRISRTCLLNVEHLKGIKQIRNRYFEVSNMKKIFRDTCIIAALMILTAFTCSIIWSGITAEIELVLLLFFWHL